MIYNEYKVKYKWMTFFDFDEYLVMYDKKHKYISFQKFLNRDFNNCDNILVNWVIYGDNGYVYINNKSLIKRFTIPDYYQYANLFEKSIVRGNLNDEIFRKNKGKHIANPNIRLCNTLGEKPNYKISIIKRIKSAKAIVKHYNTKTTEEFAKKIKKDILALKRIS